MQTGITRKKIPLWKSIEFSMFLKLSATRYKQETETFPFTTLGKHFSLPDHQLAEILILLFGL